MQLTRQILTTGGLILAAVLLLAVNVFSMTAFTSTRLDLTENRLYTLTNGTRNILAGLEEPISLTLFLSREQATRLPGISGYAQRVKELLQEYAREADGRIRLRIVDPEPFSEEEDRAVGHGLRGLPMGDGDNVMYFGLVGTSSTDAQEVIPFFSPSREEFLEHDITKLVYQLTDPVQKVVGLMTGLPMDGASPLPGRPGGRPWVIVQQLRQLFDLQTIDPTVAVIPDDVDVLMIVHPVDMGDNTLYAIDQFVLRGGRALVFVDPNAESGAGPAAMMMGGGMPTGSNLEKLFEQWGIGMAADKVAADIRYAERVRYSRDSRQAVAEYPVWINLQPEVFNSDDIVTAELGNLFFATPGALEDKGHDGISVVPLVTTSENAMLYDAAQVRFVEDPTALLRQYQARSEPLLLAARVTGKVTTAFPQGAPAHEKDGTEEQAPSAEDEQGAGGAPPHLAVSEQDINVIVVADSDLLSDGFWVQEQNLLGTRIALPTAANGDFVINALESLVGSNDLISVRSRGRFSRPFTRVAEIEQNAELRFRQKEQELLTRLQETEDKLLQLEQGKRADQALMLSEAQQQEIEQFRQEKVRIRKDLREVRRQLREDIDRLESWTKFVNIGLLPLLIGVGGVLAGVGSGRRRRRDVRGEQDTGSVQHGE